MNKGASLDKKKLNSMILKTSGNERLCDIDTTASITSKFAEEKSRQYNLEQQVCCF